MSTRIAILGVGGIGGVTGGYLARAGHDVALIDLWGANIERIRGQGLTVTALEEEFTVHPEALHLADVSGTRRLFDTVILSVKSYDTGWAAKFIEPHLAPGGFIASAQNSINEDTIAGVVGWPRVVGCVVTLGGAMYEPGHAERTSANTRPSFKVGEPSGLVTQRVDGLADVLNAVGPTVTTGNLWGERWAKLATNSMSNAVAGITGLKSAELRENGEIRALLVRIAVELVHVATALGVTVEPIGGIPASMYLEAMDDGEKMEEVEGRMVEAGRAVGTGRPSLAQDVMKGRKTEVDHLNGYVAKRGEDVGVPTPLNRALVEVTKQVENGELKQSLDNLKYL